MNLYHPDAGITWLERPQNGRVPISSDYVDRFWLPVVGPSSVALLRWMDRERPASVLVSYLPEEIGLTKSTGKNSPIWRTINRMLMFRLLEAKNETTLIAWSRVPSLTKRQLTALTDRQREAEQEWWRTMSVSPRILIG